MLIEIDLPEGFLLPEDRCGFHVNEKRKKIWAVELDLLKKFADVCERNGLSYFMDGGTLLGAVRHKGFIPWDDDVDVIMPRKDYDRLMEIGGAEFTEPYFLQTTLSMPDFFRAHAQLRNSSTTGFIPMDGEKPHINKGIWLDIFILDNLADGYFARKRQIKRVHETKELLKMKYDNPPDKKAEAYFKTHSFLDLYRTFDRKVLGGYADKNTQWVADLTLQYKPNCSWPRAYFQDYCYLDFEFLSLRAPLFYCEVLRRQYGDFRKFPRNLRSIPEEPGEKASGTLHSFVVFDPDTPYAAFDYSGTK